MTESQEETEEVEEAEADPGPKARLSSCLASRASSSKAWRRRI